MKKRDITRVVIAFLILLAGLAIEHKIIDISNIEIISSIGVDNVILVVFVVGYLIIGGDVIRTAASNILHGQIFDENFLMTIATLGAFFVHEYPEAIAVMLFYQVGEMFQSYAVNKSRKSIAELMDIKPDTANYKNEDGTIEVRKPEELNVGDIIIVKPGEKIPLDGVIIVGSSEVDNSALTGESIPRFVEAGMDVISGTINISGVLEIRVQKKYSESTVSKILDLVENASARKSKSEKFISKFARYYTPIVVMLAVALALVPTVISGFEMEVFKEWAYRACSFLVISCPCALVISVPLSFFGGIGGASAKGILIKGSNYVETLAKISTIVCDKTGTLTKGNFKVTKIADANGYNLSKEQELEILEAATLAEMNTNHPIGLSLINELKEREISRFEILENARINAKYQEISGYGVEVQWNNDRIIAGNVKLMVKNNIYVSNMNEPGTIVYVAKNQELLGYILIQDELKDDSYDAIRSLKELDCNVVMLTGDNKAIADSVAAKLGISASNVHAELLPQDKVEQLELVMKDKKEGTSVAFIGDGINDAPVLAGADVGIAMGGLGQDAAIEAADVVIMDDKMSGVVKAIAIAKKTVGIVKQNIVFALAVKILVLILAAVGIANMWMAVFADVGVAVIAILNAMRAMK